MRRRNFIKWMREKFIPWLERVLRVWKIRKVNRAMMRDKNFDLFSMEPYQQTEWDPEEPDSRFIGDIGEFRKRHPMEPRVSTFDGNPAIDPPNIVPHDVWFDKPKPPPPIDYAQEARKQIKKRSIKKAPKRKKG